MDFLNVIWCDVVDSLIEGLDVTLKRFSKKPSKTNTKRQHVEKALSTFLKSFWKIGKNLNPWTFLSSRLTFKAFNIITTNWVEKNAHGKVTFWQFQNDELKRYTVK